MQTAPADLSHLYIKIVRRQFWLLDCYQKSFFSLKDFNWSLSPLLISFKPEFVWMGKSARSELQSALKLRSDSRQVERKDSWWYQNQYNGEQYWEPAEQEELDVELWAHTDTCFPAGRRSQGSGSCKQKYTASPKQRCRSSDTDGEEMQRASGVLTQLLAGVLRLVVPCSTSYHVQSCWKKGEGKWKLCCWCGSFSSETRPLNLTATASSEDAFVRKKIITERAAVLVPYLVYQTESALAGRM